MYNVAKESAVPRKGTADPEIEESGKEPYANIIDARY